MPPDASRPSLVVETIPAIDAAAIARLSSDLHGLGCPNGILFDARECVILRDTFSSLEASSIVEDARVATDDVLRKFAGPGARPLDDRVEEWLEAMSTNWDQALPLQQTVAAPFIADIVPAASGSTVRALGAGSW